MCRPPLALCNFLLENNDWTCPELKVVRSGPGYHIVPSELTSNVNPAWTSVLDYKQQMETGQLIKFTRFWIPKQSFAGQDIFKRYEIQIVKNVDARKNQLKFEDKIFCNVGCLNQECSGILRKWCAEGTDWLH